MTLIDGALELELELLLDDDDDDALPPEDDDELDDDDVLDEPHAAVASPTTARAVPKRATRLCPVPNAMVGTSSDLHQIVGTTAGHG